jgi:hypothetical protein
VANTSIRSAAKLAVFNLLTAAYSALDPPVPTTYGWPGEELQADRVYLVGPGPGQGAVTYPVMMAGRKQREDKFTLSVILSAVAQASFDGDNAVHAAETRAEVLYAVLEDAFANDQSLNELDGVVAALLGPTVSGPDGEVIPIGAFATITADVSIEARLS